MGKVKELQDTVLQSSYGIIKLTPEEARHYLHIADNDIVKAKESLFFERQAEVNRNSTMNRGSAKSVKSTRKSKKSKRSSRKGCFSCCSGRTKTAVSQEFSGIGGGNKKRIKTKKIGQKYKRKIRKTKKRMKRNNRSHR